MTHGGHFFLCHSIKRNPLKILFFNAHLDGFLWHIFFKSKAQNQFEQAVSLSPHPMSFIFELNTKQSFLQSRLLEKQ